MKIHTNNYKEEVKKLGKQIDSKITYELDGVTVELGSEDLNSITPHYEANILKSVMKELEIDSNVEIPIGTEVNYRFGVLVDDSYEYLDFGNYIVKEIEKQEDTNSWLVKCYDKMLYSMVDYQPMDIQYPITIRNYLSTICNELGLVFANASDEFVNYNMEIPNELYFDEEGKSLGYTFRDVLDDLAEVTASTIVINNDDELEVRYINDTEDTIDEEYLKDVNVKFGEKYGAVNTVVLSRSAGADKISQSIPENLPDEQKIPVIIEDNLIMNDNDRSRFIPGILNELNDLEYYLNDFSSTGITYYDICDKYNVQVGENTYSCIMFNNEMLVTQGLQENIHTDMPEYGEVDYKKTDKTDQKINQTNLTVDKHGRQITQIISDQTNTTNRLNQTVSTLDGTIQRVSRTETSITDITTTTQVSIGKNHLYLEDAMQSNALNYQVDGATEQDTYSGKNLLPYPYEDTTKTVNGITFTDNGDGTIKINGTATANASFKLLGSESNQYTIDGNYLYGGLSADVRVQIVHYNPGYTVLARAIGSSSQIDKSTYTTGYVEIVVQSGQTVNNQIMKPMITSTQDTVYEPYVGGTVSPNPNYPQEVRNIPSIINLYNPKHTKSDGTYYVHSGTIVEQDGQFTITATGSDMFLWWHKESNISYDENAGELYKLDSDSYTVSINNPLFTKNFVTYYDENKISLGFKSKPSSTFTINKSEYPNAKYFSIRVGYGSATSGTSYSFKIQLEEGSIAHEYVPYGAYARVKITGKNILNYNKSVAGSFSPNSTSEILISDPKAITSSWISCKPNTTYIISGNYNRNRWQIKDVNGLVSGFSSDTTQITTNSTTRYLRCYYYYASDNIDPTSIQDVQIEENTEPTTYESYKEREVLIDLAKENLFTNDEERYWNKSANIYKTDNGVRIIQPDSGQYRFAGYILDANPMLGKTFTISCDYKSSNTNNVPLVNVYWFNKSTNNITTQIKVLSTNGGTFSVPSTATNDNIAILFYSNLNGSSSAANDYTDYTNIKLFEGTSKTPYYELCKIGDYKDTLSIDSSGNCIINKNICKMDMNSGTLDSYSYVSGNSDANYSQFNIMWKTNKKPSSASNKSLFKSKYFAYYYDSDKPNKTQSGLTIYGDGYPNIVLSFPTHLLTTGQESQSFINWANNNDLNLYGVLKTPEIITLPNTKIPLFDGINHVTLVDDLETNTSITYYRKTPLSGTYATVTQLNDVSTEKTTEIQTVRQEMLLNISNEAVRINAIRETIDETGVPIVKTDTGYTFDIDGMKIEKSENDVSTIVDNDGLAVSYKNTEILTARSSGVEAENITTRKFYVQRPIRMEKTKSISDGSSVGLGFYYIGE